MSTPNFWEILDKFFEESRLIIEINKGTNPVNPEAKFPVDYGYLEGTSSSDGEGIDVFIGTDPGRRVDAILCTADLLKRDLEIKILMGCTEKEKMDVSRFYETYLSMRGILIRRGNS